MVLLTPWVNSSVEAMAAGNGVRVELYNPPWIAAYVEELQVYWTKPYQEERAARLALRRTLGVE